ncbi:hypothetical protein ACFSW8_13310 [Rubritalea tangerina]|uniref:Lipoprotein n=1 Tax=Rubritalea tangerina TaxID=430798 RepID=A0ABW4ZDW6_9BACT
MKLITILSIISLSITGILTACPPQDIDKILKGIESIELKDQLDKKEAAILMSAYCRAYLGPEHSITNITKNGKFWTAEVDHKLNYESKLLVNSFTGEVFLNNRFIIKPPWSEIIEKLKSE